MWSVAATGLQIHGRWGRPRCEIDPREIFGRLYGHDGGDACWRRSPSRRRRRDLFEAELFQNNFKRAGQLLITWKGNYGWIKLRTVKWMEIINFGANNSKVQLG